MVIRCFSKYPRTCARPIPRNDENNTRVTTGHGSRYRNNTYECRYLLYASVTVKRNATAGGRVPFLAWSRGRVFGHQLIVVSIPTSTGDDVPCSDTTVPSRIDGGTESVSERRYYAVGWLFSRPLFIDQKRSVIVVSSTTRSRRFRTNSTIGQHLRPSFIRDNVGGGAGRQQALSIARFFNLSRCLKKKRKKYRRRLLKYKTCFLRLHYIFRNIIRY